MLFDTLPNEIIDYITKYIENKCDQNIENCFYIFNFIEHGFEPRHFL